MRQAEFISPARPALPALTGIRAFAAYAAVLWHAGLFVDQLYPGQRHGYLGVDVFFVLSGFILSYVHGAEFLRPTRRGYWRFMALRLGRIWPAYIVALLFVVLPLIVREQWWRDPAQSQAPTFLVHLLMLQNWGIVSPNHFNWPAWSVSAELMLYLMFPLFLWLLGRVAARWVAPLILALLLGLAVILNAAGIIGLNVTGPAGALRAGTEFAIGVLLWRLYRDRAVATWRWDLVASGAALALIAGTLVFPAWSNADYLMVMAVPPLILALAFGQGPVARLCAWPPLVFLGEISYSVYLVSWGCLWRLNTLAEAHILPQSGIAMVAATLVVSTMVGAVLHYLIERPARRWVRRRLQQGPSVPA